MARRPGLGSLIRFLAFALAAAVLTWGGAFFWFLQQIPSRPAADNISTEAIVVLTGARGRVEHGLRLLQQGKGRKLFISGVRKGVTTAFLLRRVDRAGEFKALAESGAITLGHTATDTIGNAQETAQWAKKEGVSSIRVVTTNYHMPRSMAEMKAALPEMLLVPDPFIPEHFLEGQWWHDGATRRLLLSEYHKYLGSRLRLLLLSVSNGT